ncbi:hypothetical protein [Streptomyces sp. HNM0574]|uniref:hypothetical protein n=1 Tax=Streptomyces sp. HNM0574 TaxID=2714954 RepID=UPI00146E9473|nr:hypothetical protein [Streptomyces sp. HNM0574]NLU66401.1 hypothetical protein [Streptomyces sp. HNM0574]
MTYDTPLSPCSSGDLTGGARCRVATARALRELGVTAAAAGERCRPGGPWQMLLPGVYLLHAGPPTSEERLHAALQYTGRLPIPTQPGPSQAADAAGSGEPPGARPEPQPEVMITGLAALALHGFDAAPPLRALEEIDVLVPRTRRLRSIGCARIVRGSDLPEPEQITGVPVAPVPRALADAVARTPDALAARRLLTEAVRGGHCEAQPVVRELSNARLLGRPHMVDAVDSLLAESRAVTEGLLYDMVFCHGLPDPCWNVDLRLPGAPSVGRVDAYWPDEAVAVEIAADAHGQGDNGPWPDLARKREALERLGITVVHIPPGRLREDRRLQAAIVRTALMAAVERAPAEYVVVRPY